MVLKSQGEEYRTVYRVAVEVLLVPLIGKRNDGDVYKRLGRMVSATV